MLEYAEARGWEVHCVTQEIPAWNAIETDQTEWTRFTCVKSVRAVQLDCPPVAPRQYGDEFCRLLYATERAARAAPFRAIAAQQWDVFFTTDATAAPYATALPRTTLKVLSAGDNYARRAAIITHSPSALRDIEERFTFERVESELYRLFDRVLFPTETDARNANTHGMRSAVHLPPMIEAKANPASDEHDILLRGGEQSGDLADLDWFYRHVYLPYLRQYGVRLAIAGPVAARFPVCDLRVTKLPGSRRTTARVVVAPACEAVGPYPVVMDSLATGRAVVTTPTGLRGLEVPDDAAAVIDVRAEPAGTAVVIRDLLAAPGWRKALGERAATVVERHSRTRHFTALDEAFAPALHTSKRSEGHSR